MGPGFTCTTTNLQIVLNTPKNLFFHQATQKNRQIIPVTWNPEYFQGSQ